VPVAVDVAPKQPVALISTAICVNAEQPPCGKCTAAAMGSTLVRLLRFSAARFFASFLSTLQIQLSQFPRRKGDQLSVMGCCRSACRRKGRMLKTSDIQALGANHVDWSQVMPERLTCGHSNSFVLHHFYELLIMGSSLASGLFTTPAASLSSV
jgi:hypothetical protein